MSVQHDPSTTLTLATPMAALPGIGPRRADSFRRLGIGQVSELLRHLPMRYAFEAAESSIAQLVPGSIGSARGIVAATRVVPGRGGYGTRGAKARFEATLENPSEQGDHLLLLVWFGGSYLAKKIEPGHELLVQGTVKNYQGYKQIVNPQWEMLDQADEHQAEEEKLRPIYPASEGLPSQLIAKTIAHALPQIIDQLVDPLSASYLQKRAMPQLKDAFLQVHQPEHEDQAKAARRRLAYNELLVLQLAMAMKRYDLKHRQRAPAMHVSKAIDTHIRKRFPFTLTDAQERVISQIAKDMKLSEPMNRLIQGDVGSGKTVVALYALLLAVANRKQGALMVPTELLAEQHYLSIGSMLAGSDVKLGLLTSSASAWGSKERSLLLKAIQQGEIDIVIGTQALLGDALVFHDLAVVVVDEQHRFGVLQRAAFKTQPPGLQAALEQKAQPEKIVQQSPHYLVMTATPIPRTLSLTIFGDLDVSVIDELPAGRKPIKTRVVKPIQADAVYDGLIAQLTQGQQAYVLVPAIDENKNPDAVKLKNVNDHAAYLAKRFKPLTVMPLHGQLPRQEREKIMHQFRQGKIDVLVATTIIEVGVDVPNATMMVIEHADRFGLAQLHQLRGRIGRDSHNQQSVCVLIADPKTEQAEQRLQVIAQTSDGFAIAEQDLLIRGIGDFFGTRQHGLPPLRVAQIPQDLQLLQMARRDAMAMIQADPDLQQQHNTLLNKIVTRAYSQTLGLVQVG